MTEVLQVGSLAAQPGEKVQGYLNVVNTDQKMPVTLINGSHAGKTVAITSGIHGGEYPGVETSIRLAQDLQPEELHGRVIIVHPVNVWAFQAKLQFVGPYDGKNLNRMFPGKALGTFSERVAFTISNELHAQADFYMDLHGGDIHEDLVPYVWYPTTADPEVVRISMEAAGCLGVKYVVASDSTNDTFGSAAAQGVPGLLGEIGGRGLWSEDEVLTYLRGVKNVLTYLGVLTGNVEQLCPVVYLPTTGGADAADEGCWYPAVRSGQLVQAGDKLGEIRDYFGHTLSEYHADLTGFVLHVTSSLAINSGDPLVAIGQELG
jgi:predicted deacylase